MIKHQDKNNIVGLKELRTNLETYIKRIKKGESFTVIRRSKPVFKISSPDVDDGFWETVVDLTKVDKEGVPAAEVLKTLKQLQA